MQVALFIRIPIHYLRCLYKNVFHARYLTLHVGILLFAIFIYKHISCTLSYFTKTSLHIAVQVFPHFSRTNTLFITRTRYSVHFMLAPQMRRRLVAHST